MAHAVTAEHCHCFERKITKKAKKRDEALKALARVLAAEHHGGAVEDAEFHSLPKPHIRYIYEEHRRKVTCKMELSRETVKEFLTVLGLFPEAKW